MLKKRRHRVIAVSLTLLVGFAIAWHLWPGGASRISHSLATGVLTTRQHDGLDYFLYIPTSASEAHPITALVALRGMGDQPESFASGFVPEAEANGWLLVVPGYPYGDWQQIEALKTDAHTELPWLSSLLDALPAETGYPLRERVLLYGFSRGAQSAHRFALAYPGRVLGVAAMSAGTYTLPIEHSAAYDNHVPLQFPVGVGDLDSYCGRRFDQVALKQVPFWIGVGQNDNVPSDIPRTWDKYLGTTRVERAKAFEQTIAALGVKAQLAIIPGIGHQESAESRSQAMAFLRGAEMQALSAPPPQGDESTLSE